MPHAWRPGSARNTPLGLPDGKGARRERRASAPGGVKKDMGKGHAKPARRGSQMPGPEEPQWRGGTRPAP